MRERLVFLLFASLLVPVLMVGIGCSRANPAPAMKQQAPEPAQLGEWSADVTVKGDQAIVSVVTPGVTIGWEYHLHLSLDDEPVIMASYPTYTFEGIRPGKHTLKVVIAGPDHAPLEGGEKVLTFEVR